MDLFFKLISQFGDKALLAGAVFFAVHWLGKTEAFAVMLAFTLGTTFLGMLKLYVAEPRPFFLSSYVIPASCKDLEYGFPSGHATVATSTFGTLLYCTTNKFQLRSSLRVASWILFTCFISLVCFSRLFLGLHTLDQLFVGLVVGTLIAFIVI